MPTDPKKRKQELDEARALEAQGIPREVMQPHHSRALERDERRVEQQRLSRQNKYSTSKKSADKVVSKASSAAPAKTVFSEAPKEVQEDGEKEKNPFVSHGAISMDKYPNAINEDQTAHDTFREVADHIDNALYAREDSHPLVDNSHIAKKLGDAYEELDKHITAHKTGNVKAAKTHLRNAHEGLSQAIVAYKQAFPSTPLQSQESLKKIPDLSKFLGKIKDNYITSRVPGKGAMPLSAPVETKKKAPKGPVPTTATTISEAVKGYGVLSDTALANQLSRYGLAKPGTKRRRPLVSESDYAGESVPVRSNAPTSADIEAALGLRDAPPGVNIEIPESRSEKLYRNFNGGN